MILSHCSHDTVLHIARNMRERDRVEIYSLRREENPFHVVNDVMAWSNFAWVAWLDDLPQVVIGGAELRPGVWSMFCFGTDAFPRLALGLTRFAKHTIIPTIFGKLGGHRLQCDSHIEHKSAHKWLKMLGAHLESEKIGFGKDGSTYLEFVVLRESTNPTK